MAYGLSALTAALLVGLSWLAYRAARRIAEPDSDDQVSQRWLDEYLAESDDAKGRDRYDR